ncbi:unnamed protein product, partial [Medioppia subpectinata]
MTDEPIVEENSTVSVSKQQFEEDKKAVYKHPLFPLLALLLEKCETATATLNTQAISSTNSSFNAEILAFVEHQQRDGKPFLSDDPEVDALMIKAIQVLRIHLLELEKVSELCKDFCQRYINADSDDFPLTSSSTTAFASNPTPQTVYQMVQTAQGLVAQPIQMNSSQQIQGSTPTSQIGTNNNNNNTNNKNNFNINHKSHHMNDRDSSNDEDMSDDLGSNHSNNSKKKQQKRGVLPKQATSIMRSWLFQHIVHPYPTEDEKRTIASQTNLTLLQVNNWFINARRRILQPMLDTANSLGETQGISSQSTSKSSSKSSGSKNGSGVLAMPPSAQPCIGCGPNHNKCFPNTPDIDNRFSLCFTSHPSLTH